MLGLHTLMYTEHGQELSARLSNTTVDMDHLHTATGPG